MNRALGSLSRRTSSGKWIPEIDGLRFVAIAAVVLFHTQSTLYDSLTGSLPVPNQGLGVLLMNQGQWGVELFFLISGFVLALPFASRSLGHGSEVPLRSYYLRRLTRIEPPFIVALTILLLVGQPGLSPWRGPCGSCGFSALWPHYIAGLGYVHKLGLGTFNPIMTQGWSLETEVQFYLVVPLLALIFTLRDSWVRRASVVGAALALPAFQAAFVLPSRHLDHSILMFAQFFLAGFLLADLYIGGWRGSPPKHWVWDVVSVIGWPLLVLGTTLGTGFLIVAGPWFMLLLACAALCGPGTARLLRNRWLTTIGGMCYSIYLLHLTVLNLMMHWTSHLLGASFGGFNVIGHFLLLAPVVLAVGVAFYVLVERPCMQPDWPRRFAARVRLRRLEVSGHGVAIPTGRSAELLHSDPGS